MKRVAEPGDLVYAMTVWEGTEARRGVVVGMDDPKGTLWLRGGYGSYLCRKEGVVVIPPEQYTAEEQEEVARIKGEAVGCSST